MCIIVAKYLKDGWVLAKNRDQDYVATLKFLDKEDPNVDEIFVLDEVMKECYRVLKPGGTLICFYDLWKIETLKNWIEGAKFKQLRFIEWVKTNPVPINSKINY